MKSKQQQAKESQGYDAHPVPRMCANCEHFKFDEQESKYGGYIEHKNLRCGIGGFKVMKKGTCHEHVYRLEGAE